MNDTLRADQSISSSINSSMNDILRADTSINSSSIFQDDFVHICWHQFSRSHMNGVLSSISTRNISIFFSVTIFVWCMDVLTSIPTLSPLRMMCWATDGSTDLLQYPITRTTMAAASVVRKPSGLPACSAPMTLMRLSWDCCKLRTIGSNFVSST